MANRSASCKGRGGASGYTFVGVMVLVAILAVVSAATLAVGAAMKQRMDEEELLFIGGEFAAAFRSYFEATPVGQRNYPGKLEELLRDPRYPGVRRHLRKIYVDPMTGKAEWGVVPAPNGIVGVYSLSTRAPLKVAEFSPVFAPLAGKSTYTEWKFGFLPPGLVLPGVAGLAGTLAPVTPVAGQKPPATPTGIPPKVEAAPAPALLGPVLQAPVTPPPAK